MAVKQVQVQLVQVHVQACGRVLREVTFPGRPTTPVVGTEYFGTYCGAEYVSWVARIK